MSKASVSPAIYQMAMRGHPACTSSGEARSYWGLMSETGLPPKHHNPESWMEWGEPVSIMDAEHGDTIVVKESGHHIVGLWEAWERTEGVLIFCLENHEKAGSHIFRRRSIRAIRRLRL